MARDSGRKRASFKPSEAESGGKIGFPAGATVTVTEAEWTTWGEAGENALKGGRKADDLALKIVGDVKGADEPMSEYLGAGKAERGIVPSRDGEFLELEDDATATSLNDSCNAKVFLDSFLLPSDAAKQKKSEAYKRHGKAAVPEDLCDDGISTATVGMVFVAGRIVVDRVFDDNQDRKSRPVLVVEEIVKQPKGSAGGGGGKSKRDADEDTDEDTAPARGKKAARGDDDDADAEKAAEKAGLEALDNKKYRDGLPLDKAFSAVYNIVKDDDNQKEITAFFEDEKWIKSADRPWGYNNKTDSLEAV